MPGQDEKKCPKCNTVKALEEFGVDRAAKSGRRRKCKTCMNSEVRERREQVRETDPEKWEADRARSAAAARDYRKRNPEKTAQAVRRWQINNPEKKREINRRYAKKHPEVQRALNRARKAREKGSKQYRIQMKFIRRLYLSPCVACGSTEDIHMDHILPLAKGGAHSEGNLQPLCRTCNASKQDQYMIVFRKRRGLIA